MAWYDNILQRGTNYFTGNNLTSQDPNVQNAMAKDARGVNNQLQNQSFSDLSYQDTQGVHPQKSFPRDTSALNYNIHRDPPRDWRADYQGNYGAPTQELFSNEPAVMNVDREGIMATDGAQKKPFINWDAFPSPMNAMKAMMGAVKDSPQEKFNRETFSTYTGGPMENRIYEHPASSVFGNKNVSSIFGGLDTGGQKRIDSLSKAIAKMEGPEGDATKGKWSKLYQGDKDDRAEYERRLNALRERKIAFTNQLKQYNADLVAKGIKEKAAADQAVAAAPKQIAPQHHQEQGGGGYRDAPIRSAAAAMSKGIDVGAGGMMGPGGRHYAYGGRAGYANGDMVAQETDFIEGPQGGEEFQETVVQGQEQPSREQLEALAMHIFQLPLDDLDEQQLVVVYQAAMQGQPMEENFQENIQFADQGQPMEESVQEEDVQFAAQGGLAGLL